MSEAAEKAYPDTGLYPEAIVNLARDAFGKGFAAAQAVSLPDRDELRKALTTVRGIVKRNYRDAHDILSIIDIALFAQPAAGEALSAQVERLAAFIAAEVPGEPSQSEGAINTAIRIIREQQEVEAENYRTYQWVHGIDPDEAQPTELAELFPGTLAALDNLNIRPEVQ